MKQAYILFVTVTCIILIYKTIHYRRYFSNKKLYCWLFFGRNEIVLSSTANRRVAKEQQNGLSIAAIIGLMLSCCLYFLIY